MKVREKYYNLVKRYLESPNYVHANNNLFLKFWDWYDDHEDEFTDDEKDFFKKYVIFSRNLPHFSSDVDIYK